jgi:hypothetical protein
MDESMSIETLLTLFVAAGLLGGAALLRLASIGVYRMTGRLWGRYGPTAEPTRGQLDDALPGPSLRQRADRALDGAGALLIYFVATIARGLQMLYEVLRVVVRAVWYFAVAAYMWLAPRAEALFARTRTAISAVYLDLQGKEWWPGLTENLPLMRARRTPLPVNYLDPVAIPALARAKPNVGRHAGAVPD